MEAIIFLSMFLWGGAYVLLSRSRIKGERIPLDSLPVMFSFVLLVYGTVPPLVWSWTTPEGTPIHRYRLHVPPSTEEHVHLLSLGVVFLASFVYGALRYRERVQEYRSMEVEIPWRVVVTCIVIILFNICLNFALAFTGVISRESSYIESYSTVQNLPLSIRIAIKFSGSIALFAKIIVLVWLFRNWRAYWFWICIVITSTVVFFNPAAGRSETFVLLLACIILWNRFVKPLSFIQMGVVSSVLLLAFTVAGIYRGFAQEGREMSLNETTLTLGEFDAPWSNAIDLYREQKKGTLSVPVQLHFCELYSPIPAAFLPFEKWGYAGWYVNEFYPSYAKAGGGLMFGLFAQLVIGFGLPDIILRGYILGYALTWGTRVLQGGKDWWHYPTLVYLCVWNFYSIRDSSFSLLNNLVQTVALAVIGIHVLSGFRIRDIRIFP